LWVHLFGNERHLHSVLADYVAYENADRTHRSLASEPSIPASTRCRRFRASIYNDAGRGSRVSRTAAERQGHRLAVPPIAVDMTREAAAAVAQAPR
jgi:hypothetical protein